MRGPGLRAHGDPLLVTETAALRHLPRICSGHRIRWIGSWEELGVAARTVSASAVAVVDPYMEGDGGLAPGLQRLLVRQPLLAVVAAVPPGPDMSVTVATLVEWGASEILDLELERSARAAGRRIRAAHARPLKRMVEGLLGSEASEHAFELVRAACEAAVERGGAAEFAAKFGADPRSITAWCAREGLPPPRRLLAWIRVLLGTGMLAEGRSVLGAAHGAGYGSDNAFRRAVRGLAGCDVSRAPATEFHPRAGEVFTREVRERRAATKP